jgi:hypothetical protein
MELIGSLFLVLAVALVVGIFVAQPFVRRKKEYQLAQVGDIKSLDHQRSSLMAQRDRVLTALQELDFDNALGKVPQDEYPQQRSALLKTGAEVLRHLDELSASMESEVAQRSTSVEDRIEAAVAARRADARQQADAASPAVAAGSNGGSGAATSGAATSGAETSGARMKDELEELIASRKRVRTESSAGFCPRCGRPVLKTDKFCSRCGATL